MLGQVFGTSRPAVGEHKVRLRNPQFLLFLLRFHDCMVLRIHRCKNRPICCLQVAPVVLPASRQHHFRSTALGTATSAEPSQPSHGSTDSGILSRTTSGRSVQAPGDCSAVAPLTALRPGQAGPEGYPFSFCSILFRVSKNLPVATAGPIRRSPKVFQPNICHQEV